MSEYRRLRAGEILPDRTYIIFCLGDPWRRQVSEFYCEPGWKVPKTVNGFSYWVMA